MSNLGPYQEIVVEAARHGGVEGYIRNIQSVAVMEATPGLLGKGFGFGVLGTLAAGGLVLGVGRLRAKRAAVRAAGEDAKERLRIVLSDQEAVDGTSLSYDDAPRDPTAEATQ